jgi:hypothetical protein
VPVRCFRTSRPFGLLAAWACLAALVACPLAAAEPERLVLDMGSGAAVYYRFGGRQYREVAPGALGTVGPGLRVAVTGKFGGVEDGQVLLRGETLPGVRLELQPGVRLDAELGGNVGLGGTVRREGGATVLGVEAATTLPDDLERFRRRLAELEAAGTETTAADYVALAWWLEDALVASPPPTQAGYDRYAEAIRTACARAIDRLGAYLAEDAPAGAAGIRDALRAIREAAADAPAGAETEALVARIDAYLERAGGAEPPAPATLRAGAAVLLGDLAAERLGSETAAAEWYLRAARWDPDHPGVARALDALGYERAGEAWLTPEAARRRSARAASDRAAGEREAVQAARRAAERSAREALLSAREVGKRFTVVAPLLDDPEPESVALLARRLPELPEDVAREALWRAAALPGETVLPLAGAALAAESPRLRMDAMDLLAASADPRALQTLVDRIAAEEDADVVRHGVRALYALPDVRGVGTLIHLLDLAAVPGPARALAIELLEAETGQAFGRDAFAWKQWWREHGATWRRPPRGAR